MNPTELDPPEGCTDPTIGRAYWHWVANPDSVTDPDERIRLLRHTASCAACLDRLLPLLGDQLPTPTGDRPPG